MFNRTKVTLFTTFLALMLIGGLSLGTQAKSNAVKMHSAAIQSLNAQMAANGL